MTVQAALRCHRTPSSFISRGEGCDPAATLRFMSEEGSCSDSDDSVGTTAALIRPRTTSTPAGSTVQLVSSICLWYASSMGLTLGNKWLFGDKGYLPCPLLITALHIATKALVSRLIMWHFNLSSLLFGSRTRWCARIAPVGLATALDIGLSNASFQFITVTQYTIAKSSAPVWILIISVALGLQQPRPALLLVVISIASGIALACAPGVDHDEVHAAAAGHNRTTSGEGVELVSANSSRFELGAASFDPAHETRKALQWLSLDGGDDATFVPHFFRSEAHLFRAAMASPHVASAALGWGSPYSQETVGLTLVLGAAMCSAFRWAWMEMLLRPAAAVETPMERFGEAAEAELREHRQRRTGDFERGPASPSKAPCHISPLTTALLKPLALVNATASFGFCAMLPIAVYLEASHIRDEVAAHAEQAHYGRQLFLRAAAATLLGGLLAFGMLIVELRIVQLASSLTLSIAGILKEVLTVAASAVLFGDELTLLNAAGLALCLAGIAGYNQLKVVESPATSEEPD